MLYTLTLNPSIDLFLYPDALRIGKTNRSLGEHMTYGGKGINVAAVALALGADVTALGAAGGFTGDALLSMLDQAGIPHRFIRLSSDTRINVKLSLQEGMTEINAKGPLFTDAEKNALKDLLCALGEKDFLVLSGSLPASFGIEGYADIIKALTPRGVRFAVDTTGDVLLSTLPYHPFVIKPNLDELCELVGKRLVTPKELEEAMRTLQRKGAERVLLSMGGEGAMLLDADGTLYRSAAPKGEVRGTVGAGDSMLAGFLYAATKGESAGEALRLAVAAGSATAFSDGLANGESIRRVKNLVTL